MDNPHIFTHMFIEGQIISTARSEYADIVDDPENEKKVRKLMQDQHKSLMKELRKGAFDEKIMAMMGVVDPEEAAPSLSLDEAEAPAAAAAEPAEKPAAPAAAAETEAPTAPAKAPPAAAEPPPVPADLPPAPTEAAPPPAEASPMDTLQSMPSGLQEVATDEEAVPAHAEEPQPVPDTLKEEGPPTLKEEDLPLVTATKTIQEEIRLEDLGIAPEPEAPPTPEPLELPPPASTQPPPPPPVRDLDSEVTQAIDVRALRARISGGQDIETTQPISLRSRHGLDRHAGEELPLFPPEEPDVAVIVDGARRDDGAEEGKHTTYSHVYRGTGDHPASRVETPMPGRQRLKTPLPPKTPMRRQSRVFGQPLPGSTRYPSSSDDLPSVGALPRRSGVYLVPGGPPKRPPHPDPALRGQWRPEQRSRASSPQRYVAPGRSQTKAPAQRPRRQTGAYEVQAPRPSKPQGPVVRPPTRQRIPMPRQPEASRTSSPAVKPPPPRPPQKPPPAPPPRPPAREQVMARPVVVVGQPVSVGKHPAAPRAPTPPQTTPRNAPRARQASKPRAAKEPSSVFGSDLISERSLDEVILAYLAEDGEGEGEE